MCFTKIVCITYQFYLYLHAFLYIIIHTFLIVNPLTFMYMKESCTELFQPFCLFYVKWIRLKHANTYKEPGMRKSQTLWANLAAFKIQCLRRPVEDAFASRRWSQLALSLKLRCERLWVMYIQLLSPWLPFRFTAVGCFRSYLCIW